MTPAEIRSIEPALRGQFHGGFYNPPTFTGDIHKFTIGLAEACERRGVAMRFSTEVLATDALEDHVSLTVRSTEPVRTAPRRPPRPCVSTRSWSAPAC